MEFRTVFLSFKFQDLSRLSRSYPFKRRVETSLKISGLPFTKSIDELDFAIQPRLDRQKVISLFDMRETLIWAKRDDKSKKYTLNYRLMKTLNNDKQMRSDWYFPICNGGERLKDRNGNKLHTTQKPKALLERIILASTNKDDVVLDPFAGTGTTGAAAKEYHRNFILIEKSRKYIPYIRKRLNKVQATTNFNSKIKELKRAA